MSDKKKPRTAYLGKQTTELKDGRLDLIAWPGGKTTVTLHTDEFTSFCPVTKQPDFASMTITYIPDKFLVETKSFKLYMRKFREEKEFNEKLVRRIALELTQQIQPFYLKVEGEFNSRGGINVKAVYSIAKK